MSKGFTINSLNADEMLTDEKIAHLAKIAVGSISGHGFEETIDSESFNEEIEQRLLEGTRGLPELLAGELKTVNVSAFDQRAEELLLSISQEIEDQKMAELQIQLIYQWIGVISRVQNGGDKGFTPSVAKEVNGLDCSLSAWSLKEKLQSFNVPKISFEFGYPPGHAVCLIKVADGRQIYVDAQNGFVEEVNLEQVFDEEAPELAYPIFEVKSSKRIVGYLPGEGEVTRARLEGSDYLPKYFGVRKDGLLHTLGNMHMFVNPASPVFYTESAKKFREGIGMPEMESLIFEGGKRAMQRWQIDRARDDELGRYFAEELGDNLGEARRYAEDWRAYYADFQKLVDLVAGGKTIYETKFNELERQHHSEFQKAQ